MIKIVKKVLKFIIEYLLVLSCLAFFCFYINRNIIMKALYMDDLYHWSWFRGLNLFDFAFKFYETSRYRPVFETIQYLIYMIVDTDPTKIIFINKIYNSLIALFIYHFIKKLNVGRIISLAFSILYLIAHYSYYQIGQGIGSLESSALFFSLVILLLCLKLSGVISKKNDNGFVFESSKGYLISITICIYLMYIIIAFTHERFLGLALPIILAILFSKATNEKILSKRKIISLILLICEICLICYIRYIAIGKVMPAGTGGTYVENTFDLSTCINYCFRQVKFIFGINVGPDYLVGIEFENVANKYRIYTFISIALILSIVVIYLCVRVKIIIKNFIQKHKNNISESSFTSDNNELAENVNNFKEKKCRNYLASDLIFLTFIAMCIGASSVTIRIEMRFIYVSFTVAIIYLSYMCSYIFEIINNKIIKFLFVLIMLIIVLFRIPIEMEYRSNYDKLYCFVDMKKANSIYDCTIGKYGLDDILKNKKIYIIKNYYDINEFYAEYLLKIYDKKNVGNKIIIVDSIGDIPIEDIKYDTIVLYEDLENMEYKQLQYE